MTARTVALLLALACALAFSVAPAEGSTSPGAFVPFVAGGQRSADCHPSYPTICLPAPPPDLDCSQIPYQDFVVLPPDPHGLDRDKDGIGCETLPSKTCGRACASPATVPIHEPPEILTPLPRPAAVLD